MAIRKSPNADWAANLGSESGNRGQNPALRGRLRPKEIQPGALDSTPPPSPLPPPQGLNSNLPRSRAMGALIRARLRLSEGAMGRKENIFPKERFAKSSRRPFSFSLFIPAARCGENTLQGLVSVRDSKTGTSRQTECCSLYRDCLDSVSVQATIFVFLC